MSVCGIDWPVCPHCTGEGLWSSAGRTRCRHCARVWRESEVRPCPWPATVLLTHAEPHEVAEVLHVCESHAAHPSAAALRQVHSV